MRFDRFLWFCVILAILLLCGYELAHCQIVPASEMRLTAGTPYTVPGRYQIMINSATGRITCTTPTGTDCSPTAGSIAWGAITGVPSTFPPSAHTHSAADINAGILSPLYGGTGFNGAPADIILVGNGTTYDQRSLCTGYVKYSLTTHLLTCDAGTGGSFTGGTLTGKLTLAPSTTANSGLNLNTAGVAPTTPAAGDFWPNANWDLNWSNGGTTYTAERTDRKGQPNGYAPLDAGGLVPVGNLPAGSTGVNVTGNAQQYAGFCTGTASSSATLVIPPFGTANASSCSSTTTTNELPMSWSGTLRNLQVKAGTAGRLSTSGVVTLYKNGVATGITCTIGTGTICSDVTHTSTVNVGDTVGIRMTTQSTETLANVRVTFEDYGGGTGFNYRGTWLPSTIYNTYDVVSYNGSTYERGGPTFTSAGTFNSANWNVWAAGATGVPIGGTTGQVLAKNSATDFDVGWVTGGGGGGSGTVTSVALTAPSQFTVSGSPVTTSGTLALTWATQAANIVFAGPTSGGAATPGFRALVAADIPTLNQSTTGNAATATALAANGTNCAANQFNKGVDASGNAESCAALVSGDIPNNAANTTGTAAGLSGSQTANFVYAAPSGSAGTAAFRALVALDVPTLNQNTTGTSANVTGTVAIGNGGTGQTTKIPAFNALSPLTTLGDVIYHDGTNSVRLAGNTVATRKFLRQLGTGAVSAAPAWDTILAADIPTLNQSTTGTAANVTGIVAEANGGTGAANTTGAAGHYLRSNATHYVDSAIQAGDVPTLNQSTTGNAGTATALAANGTNCSAGSVGAGVDASGNEEGCTATVNPTAHNLLSTAHGDTTAATVTRGGIITGQTATPKWQLLAAGSASQCLQMDASGVDIVWGACAVGGSGSPGGSPTQVQFNDSGAFGGDTGFTWDKTNDILTIGPAVTNYQTWAWTTQTANRTVTWPDSVGPGFPKMDASGNVTYTTGVIPAIVVDGVQYTTIADAEAACPVGGCRLFVPPGTYAQAFTLNVAGTQLECASPASTTITVPNADANGLVIAVSASNVRISNCTIDGNIGDATNRFGIGINTSVASLLTNIEIDHNIIKNTKQEGIVSHWIDNLRIHHNTFTNTCPNLNCYAINISENNAGVTDTDTNIHDNEIDQSSAASGGINVFVTNATAIMKNLHVVNNTIFTGDGGTGYDTLSVQLFVNNGGTLIGSEVTGNTITCVGATTSHMWGISMGGLASDFQVSVLGNTIRNCSYHSLEVQASNVIVNGNTVVASGPFTITNPIGSAITMQGIEVNGNNFSNGTSTLADLEADAAAGLEIRGLNVNGNTFSITPTGGRAVFFNGNVNDGMVNNNVILGQGTGHTFAAIQILGNANQVALNTIRDYAGAGAGGQGVLITAGAYNQVGPNFYYNVTTPISDTGTGTNFFEQQGQTAQFAPSTTGYASLTLNSQMANPGYAPAAGCGHTAGLPCLTVSNTGGTITNASATTLFVKYTFNNGASAETLPSPEGSIAVNAANGCLAASTTCSVTMTAPYLPPNATGYTVYNFTSTGTEKKQTTLANCQNITASCVIGTIATGATVPTTNTALASATPTSPVPGAIWNDGSNLKFRNGPSTINLAQPGLSTMTAASAAINTTETVITKTTAMQLNRLQAGTVIRVTYIGTCTTTAANTSTFTLRWGTAGTTADGILTQLVTGAAATTGTAIPFKAVFEVTVRTTGASATGYSSLTLQNQGVTGISSATTGNQIITGATTAIDTTLNNAILSATYKSAATTTTSTFQEAFIEIVYQ